MKKDKLKNILHYNKILMISNIILFSITSIISVGAVSYLYNSKDVSYDNKTSKIKSTDVQGAIDELYEEATNYSSINTRLTALENNLLDKTYPIGSIYISVEDDTVAKVKAKFGGEWESFGSGRTLVGVDTNNTKFNEISKTGGSSTKTIEVSNLPNHTHKYTPSGTNSYSTKDLNTNNSGYIANGITGGSHSHTFQKPVLNYAGSNAIALSNSNGAWRGSDLTNTNSTNSSTHTHNLPNHTHSISAANLKTAIGTITFTGTEKSTTACTNCSGTALDVQNPYITVYMYKRVS